MCATHKFILLLNPKSFICVMHTDVQMPRAQERRICVFCCSNSTMQLSHRFIPVTFHQRRPDMQRLFDRLHDGNFFVGSGAL